MDKRKGMLNVVVSVGFKILTMIMVVIVKRFLINICGNDANGLNALYISIIGFLSVAELGVGSAITFCLYKPIVQKDNDTVSALYYLFRKVYIIIGGIIFAGGLAVIPFLGFLAKDYEKAEVNLGLTFFLMLVSVVITYLFSCKSSLINAYKNNYITTAISSGCLLLQYFLQIIVLIITKSFTWYLVCRIFVALVQWVITDIVTRKKYLPILLNKKGKLQSSVKRELLKNIKAMFMHKVGYILVNTVDSVVISAFVGVIALGTYSNYIMILTSLTEMLKLVFTSLTSVIGHSYIESNKETSQKNCERFHLLNFILGCIFFLGYYAVIDNLIAILFSADLVVSKSVSIVVTLNGFIQFMRQSTLVFREATGTFYNDRWKPLLEGCINIVLSIIFVQWIGVTGVIVATIITNLLICHIIEPYVLYKNAFEVSPKKYYFKNYTRIFLFLVALAIFECCKQSYKAVWTEFFVNGLISVSVSIVICLIVGLLNWNSVKSLIKKFDYSCLLKET